VTAVPLLRVENLRAHYLMDIYGIKRAVKAVDGVSFEVEENTIFGIAGESGCGKTTLIKVLSATFVPPLTIQAGRVIYDLGNGSTADFLSLREEERRGLRWAFLSYVPQGSMNVLNPVSRVRSTFRDFMGAHRPDTTPDLLAEVREHLGHLGLPPEVLSSYPHQLSGGMRQRTTLALATILRPRLILADEPTTALDVVVQRGVIQLLRRIQAAQKNTVILVTHDMAVHANLTNRLAIMYAGKIVEESPTAELFRRPLHPYTKFLIGSLPRIGDKTYKVSAPGAPPSLANLPPGCTFHPRCPHAMDACRTQEPELVSVSPGHKVACFLSGKNGTGAT
jgi:peptide/nickel transport system ATP-binding protein